jgi:hypothetical protein
MAYKARRQFALRGFLKIRTYFRRYTLENGLCGGFAVYPSKTPEVITVSRQLLNPLRKGIPRSEYYPREKSATALPQLPPSYVTFIPRLQHPPGIIFLMGGGSKTNRVLEPHHGTQ